MAAEQHDNMEKTLPNSTSQLPVTSSIPVTAWPLAHCGSLYMTSPLPYLPIKSSEIFMLGVLAHLHSVPYLSLHAAVTKHLIQGN